MKELIDKNMALEALEDAAENFDYDGEASAEGYSCWGISTGRIEEVLNKQPVVNLWTPCKDRMPYKGTKCLVCTKQGIELLGFSNDGWQDFDGNRINGVTAWIELPTPYREEK